MQTTSGTNFNVNLRVNPFTNGAANPLKGLDKSALTEFVANLSEADLQTLFQQLDPNAQEIFKNLLIELGYANLAALLATSSVANTSEAVFEVSGPNLLSQPGGMLGATEDRDHAPVVADGPINRTSLKNLAILLDQVIANLVKQNQNMISTQNDARKLMTLFADVLARYTVQLKIQTANTTLLQANTAAQEQYDADMVEVTQHYINAGKSFGEAAMGVASLGYNNYRNSGETALVQNCKKDVATAQTNCANYKNNTPLPAEITDKTVFTDTMKLHINGLKYTINAKKQEIRRAETVLQNEGATAQQKQDATKEIATKKDEIKSLEAERKEAKNANGNHEHERIEMVEKYIAANPAHGIAHSGNIANYKPEVQALLKTQGALAKQEHEILNARSNISNTASQIVNGSLGAASDTSTAVFKAEANEEKNKAETDRAYGQFLNSTGEASASVINDLLQDIKAALQAEKDEILQSLAAVADILNRLGQAGAAANSM